jgi:hypothetical protein
MYGMDDTDNFLAQLLGNQQQPSFMQPSAPSNVLASPMAGSMQPGAGPGPSYEDIQAKAYADAGVPQGRKRASVIDILGGLADSIANIGGVDAGYQPTLDAATERQRQAEGDAMDRQKFALNQRRGEQQIQGGDLEIQDARNKMFAQAASGLKNVYDRYGAQGVAAMWPKISQIFGISPQQEEQLGQMFQENPDMAFQALAGLGDPKTAKYGTSIYYAKGPDGALHAFQASEGGGLQQANLPAGYTLQPGVQVIDQGPTSEVISKPTGEVIRTVVKAAPPGPGEELAPNGQGGFTATVRPGSAPAREEQDKIDETLKGLRGLDAAFESNASIFPEIRAGIDEMTAAGSLGGAPGQNALDNARAAAYDTSPTVERIVNPAGFSARQKVLSAGMTAVQQLEPLIKTAQGAGITLSSKMMDTPKELENLLKQVVNTSDYGAANQAYERFQRRYDDARAEVKAEIAKQQRGNNRQPLPGKIQLNSAPASGGFKYLGTE